ncbi:hypothetical protein [Chryseobacterium paridis]|uniref:Uncharacterized protein n=1 Tax=Chryseobacterium paridis TaxID=2800328 RepID=A0ABS1FTM5_9FLAO|nr:hypothetical protein [Chryseobacterium paridis]MBK1895770.1 hypothetical protein [Chryseobacterium paridis]
MRPKQIPGVPVQERGGFHDTESQKNVGEPNLLAQNFDVLKKRFFSINEWQQYSGEGSAEFKLYNSAGVPVEGAPEIGYFIRIDIPGPGESEAKGFDWVEIINISHHLSDHLEYFLITCRPSKIPGNVENNHIAHFYSSKATSTFMISKTDEQIKAAVYGRNESPNYDARFIDKIRNIFIAVGGMMGTAKIQWKTLSDGLLDFD